MPLPSALAAKLAKRGLLTSKKQEPPKKTNYKGWSACPNKWNVYHECTTWCETHWKGVIAPDPRYTRNMQKLLFKYPLPSNWTEVFDKGVYYYWNIENDLVSWLPPRHPKSVKTLSAAKLREKRLLQENENTNSHDKDRDRDSDKDDRESDDEKRPKDRGERDERRNRRDDRYNNRNKRRRDDIIDPMDPAAYSDIPQGTWSDGLENNKTRADNTASGVLYQQRPYPAPGEVLASNKEKNKKK